jgi:Ca2+-binding EF-hand superfamily protein
MGVYKVAKNGRKRMISRRTAILAAIGTTLVGGVPGLAASDYELLKGLDGDHDGTVDLDEATKAGRAVFEMIDRDGDGRLTRHELSGRLSVRELRAADPDHDATLNKGEYLALVAARFQAADVDGDGALTVGELRSKAGRALLRLLK